MKSVGDRVCKILFVVGTVLTFAINVVYALLYASKSAFIMETVGDHTIRHRVCKIVFAVGSCLTFAINVYGAILLYKDNRRKRLAAQENAEKDVTFLRAKQNNRRHPPKSGGLPSNTCCNMLRLSVAEMYGIKLEEENDYEIPVCDTQQQTLSRIKII